MLALDSLLTSFLGSTSFSLDLRHTFVFLSLSPLVQCFSFVFFVSVVRISFSLHKWSEIFFTFFSPHTRRYSSSKHPAGYTQVVGHKCCYCHRNSVGFLLFDLRIVKYILHIAKLVLIQASRFLTVETYE